MRVLGYTRLTGVTLSPRQKSFSSLPDEYLHRLGLLIINREQDKHIALNI